MKICSISSQNDQNISHTKSHILVTVPKYDKYSVSHFTGFGE